MLYRNTAGYIDASMVVIATGAALIAGTVYAFVQRASDSKWLQLDLSWNAVKPTTTAIPTMTHISGGEWKLAHTPADADDTYFVNCIDSGATCYPDNYKEGVGLPEAKESTLAALKLLSGAYTVTVQFYRTATTTPIPDVAADVYDATETARLNGTQLKSDVNGRLTFKRDNGTYKVRAMLAGFNFTTGTVVVADGNVTLIIYGAAAVADAPAPVGAMRVYDFFFMPDGVTPMAAAPVAPAKIINLPYDYNGRLHSGQSLDVTYNAGTGKGYWDLAPGATVEFDLRNFRDRVIQKTLPLTDPDNEIRLEDIV